MITVGLYIQLNYFAELHEIFSRSIESLRGKVIQVQISIFPVYVILGKLNI